MAYGLRVWNSSNVLRLDLTTKTSYFQGVISHTSTGNTAQNISVPGMESASGRWSVMIISPAQHPTLTIAIGTDQFTITNAGTTSYKFLPIRI